MLKMPLAIAQETKISFRFTDQSFSISAWISASTNLFANPKPCIFRRKNFRTLPGLTLLVIFFILLEDINPNAICFNDETKYQSSIVNSFHS